jgi:hypothetical protein
VFEGVLLFEIFIFEILGCAVLANKIRKLSEKILF